MSVVEMERKRHVSKNSSIRMAPDEAARIEITSLIVGYIGAAAFIDNYRLWSRTFYPMFKYKVEDAIWRAVETNGGANNSRGLFKLAKEVNDAITNSVIAQDLYQDFYFSYDGVGDMCLSFQRKASLIRFRHELVVSPSVKIFARERLEEAEKAQRV